jgi:signal transduction histidine kinase
MACSYNKDHIIATDRFDNHYSLFLNTTQDSILKKEPLFPMNVESEKPATKLFHTRKALYQSAPDGLLKYNPANHSFQEMTLFDAYVAQHPLDILEPDADGLMWFWKNDSRGTGGSWGQTKNGEIIFDTTAFCRLGHLHIRDIDFFRNHTIFTTGKHLVLYKKDSRETNQKLYGYLASVYDIAADTIIHGPFRTPSDTTLLLKAAQNHLKFTITSNHICKDHVLYYLWDIEGLETGPVSWSTKPKKHFSNLKPGVYHTRFKIKDPYGKIYTLPSLQITIQKPWYLTPLALTAFGIIFIALFILIVLIIRFIHRKKTNNLAKEIARRTHELKIQNQELEKEKSTILELNNTKDKFFSIIAHDLRSPFSALMGLSEVLQEDYHQLDEKERLEIISHIRKSAEFSFSLLDNLLTWSRSQRNQIKPNPKEYHVADSIKEAIAPLESSLKRKQIHLNIDIDKNLKGYFDRNMAVTIFRNLVSNAIKFTNRGGVIELKGKKNQNEIIVSVTDNGIGISEEEQRNLFDIGKQTKRKGTEKESGTGLGLILCKDFAEQNHGHIEIQSELNKGSTFSVFLPKSPLNERSEKATFSE